MEGIIKENVVADAIIIEDQKYGKKLPKVTVPKNRQVLCHAVFFLLGISHFLPLTFFSAANNFWLYKFRNTSLPWDPSNPSIRTTLQVYFPSVSMIAMTVPSLLFGVFNVTHSNRFKIVSRLILTVAVEVFIFIILTVGVLVNTDKYQEIFYAIVLISYTTLAAANTVNMVATMNLYPRFPHTYMKTCLAGEGSAGILGDVINIFSVSMFRGDIISSTMVYFTAGSIGLGVTFALTLITTRMNFFKKCLETVPQDVNKKMPGKYEIWENLKKVRFGIILVLFTMFGMSASFPSIAALVVSEQYAEETSWAKDYFSPVITFFLSNCGMLGGRLLSAYLPIKIPELLFILITVLRTFILVPGIWLCNAQPRSHLPVIFDRDYQYGIILGVFMLTNGYLINTAALSVAQKVEGKDADVAYTVFGLALNILQVASSPVGVFIVRLL